MPQSTLRIVPPAAAAPRRLSWRQQRRRALMVLEPVVRDLRPALGTLDGLSRDELTAAAQRAAKLAARATRRAMLSAPELPAHWSHWAARVAAARAGAPYYKRRAQLGRRGSPFPADPRCGGFHREARSA